MAERYFSTLETKMILKANAKMIAMANDAARYRALRDRPRIGRRRVVGVQVVDYENRDEGRLLYGDDLDAALDRMRHG